MKKKIILTFIIIIISSGILYCSVLCYKKMNEINSETNIEGKDTTKEEYLYKEELLNIGYNINEISTIQNKISNTDVRKYLLTTKYNNLTSFIDSPYFKIENTSRYQSYFDINLYTIDEIVIYVNIGIDKEFYTNIKNVDMSKNYLMLVNKYNKLEENYVPELVDIDNIYGKGKMQANAYNYFTEMCDSAREENITLKSVSAYRSYNTQKNLYNTYSKKGNADSYSARPGHSEHQTGLAVDINVASSSSHFEKTKEYEWLINNSYKYGFILRYPNNKTFITGYKYEPWHFRYIGIEASTKIYESQITFEEYLVKYAK